MNESFRQGRENTQGKREHLTRIKKVVTDIKKQDYSQGLSKENIIDLGIEENLITMKERVNKLENCGNKSWKKTELNEKVIEIKI